MFYFLFAIEHLPAVQAEYFSVRLGLDNFYLMNEFFPFRRLDLDHRM